MQHFCIESQKSDLLVPLVVFLILILTRQEYRTLCSCFVDAGEGPLEEEGEGEGGESGIEVPAEIRAEEEEQEKPKKKKKKRKR